MSEYSEILTDYISNSFERILFDSCAAGHLRKCLESKTGYRYPFGHLAVHHFLMYGGESLQTVLPAAAAAELLVLSFDIFDDLQDRDNPAPYWMGIPTALAMNLALALLPMAETLLEQIPIREDAAKIALLRRFHELAMRSIQGQITDVSGTARSEEAYLAMAERKSGSLCAAACILGASLVPCGSLTLVESYAMQMGVVGQLRNDLQDLWRWDDKSDLLNKKTTLPILYLLEYGDEASEIKRYYAGEISREELSERQEPVMRELRNSGVEEYMASLIRIRQVDAFAAFEQTGRSLEWKKVLAPYF